MDTTMDTHFVLTSRLPLGVIINALVELGLDPPGGPRGVFYTASVAHPRPLAVN